MTTTSAVYPSTFMGAGGCDSAIVSVVDVVAIDTTVALNGAELRVGLADANYQWLDCNNGMEPIEGADMQHYAPPAAGVFAVDVTVGACTARSGCHVVLSTGMVMPLQQAVSIIPNPTSGPVRVVGLAAGQRVTVWNCLGERIRIRQSQAVLDLSDEPAGVYFLRVEDGAGPVRTVRVLKQ
ncbi:MAG: T9SS type A sorting domain-containing protein [Flavobacteriales bacterium]